MPRVTTLRPLRAGIARSPRRDEQHRAGTPQLSWLQPGWPVTRLSPLFALFLFASCTPDEAVVVADTQADDGSNDTERPQPDAPSQDSPASPSDAGVPDVGPDPLDSFPFFPQPTEVAPPPDESLAEHTLDCDGFAQKLRDCELLSDGPVSCDPPVNEAERCLFICHSIASCNILQQYNCSEAVPVPLESCFQSCFTYFDTYTCGSGERIPPGWQCDGEADCIDGSDELDCEDFECGDGETIPAAWQCDFQPDCLDASDEEACPDRFTCTSGEEIPDAWECDGEDDCPDGSDERDCKWFTCEATQELLSPRLVCNQIDDCLDGSDEVGCAQLQCR